MVGKLRSINIFGGPYAGQGRCAKDIYEYCRANKPDNVSINISFTNSDHSPYGVDAPDYLVSSWHLSGLIDEKRLAAWLNFVDPVNIFMLRSEYNSDVRQKYIEEDSRIFSLLHENRSMIHTIPYSKEAYKQVITILETKGWLQQQRQN